MDLRAMKLKHLKKVCKRAKRKYVTLWKTFGILFLILTLLTAPMCLAVKVVDNALAGWIGGSFWELENRDETAQYFKPDHLNARELSHQAALEGITLLKNENAALPLAAGTSISLLGADQLKAALEAEGFTVRDDSDTAIVVYDGSAHTIQDLSTRKKSGSLKKIIFLLTGDQVSFLKDNSDFADGILWVGERPEAQAVAEILSGKVSPSGSLPKTLSFDTVPAGAGVYEGYKYFETRYEDKQMNTGNAGDYIYENQVAYPFGYGLSYTTFAYSDFAVTCDEKTDSLTVKLKVTNTGDRSGVETVQLYAQALCTDEDRAKGVEKPAIMLVGFVKTLPLAPGTGETVTVTVDKGNFAFYKGTYYLTAAADAHSAVNNILTAKGVAAGGDAALTFTWEDTAVKTVESAAGTLSRRDWQATLTTQVPAEDTRHTSRYNPADYPVTQMPTLGAENGLKLVDMIGLPMDDAKWQTLLDQLTFVDMVTLLADNYFLQLPVSSVQAPGALHRSVAEMGLPSAQLLAATFNTRLVEDTASAVGNVCLDENVVILRGEMAYSEDGFLTDKIANAQDSGLQKKGVLGVVYAQSPGFVQDAILAGEALVGQWLPREAWELYQWENDPVIVTAMRQACHRNLYALANSCAMNGIGEATTVKTCLPGFVLSVWIAAPVCLVVFLFFAIMWHRGIKKWKKTQEYLDYQTMKTTLKEEKKK